MQPRVRNDRGQFVPYEPTGEIRAEIAKAIDGSYSTAVFSWPRRHGKTVAAVMIALWRFLSRTGESIAIVANSEKQAVDTAFKALLDAFRQTPFLKALVDRGEIKLVADRVEAPELSNTIQAYTSNPAALWGKKLTLAQISELHAANDDGVLDALQGSLLDSSGSLLLIDSTVGPKSSPLFGLYNAANDPTSGICFSHIQYKDLDDALAKSPAWIDRAKLLNLHRTMLPTQFALMHLNRWQDASGALFPADVIKQCTDTYPLDVKAIVNAAAHVVGGGLDRAYGMSKHGDATVTSCVVKVMQDEDEHFYVLASDSVFLSRGAAIRANFSDYARRFNMSHVGCESYNAQDIHDWLVQQPFGDGVELITPTRTTKAAAFTSLYTIAAEGRLHIHPSFKKLLGEMETFEVVTETNGQSTEHAMVPKFKHAKGCHDDHLHALAWAIHAMRERTLNPYEIDGVVCNSTAAVASLCALNGGQMIPACADECRSMCETKRLFAAYLARRPLVPLPFDEFVAVKVKNIGAHSLPR